MLYWRQQFILLGFEKNILCRGINYVDVENYVIPKNVAAVTIAVFMFCL